MSNNGDCVDCRARDPLRLGIDDIAPGLATRCAHLDGIGKCPQRPVSRKRHAESCLAAKASSVHETDCLAGLGRLWISGGRTDSRYERVI